MLFLNKQCILFCFVSKRVLPCSLSCSKTHSVDQGGLELTEMCLPLTGLKLWVVITPGYKSIFMKDNKCFGSEFKIQSESCKNTRDPSAFHSSNSRTWLGRVCRGRTLSQRGILYVNHDPPAQACHTEQTPGTLKCSLSTTSTML